MARIRSIKPEFWDDRKLAKRTSRDARLLYIALWNLADEHGRLNGDPQWIKGQVFSYDDDIDATVIAKLLEELAAPALGAVIPYEIDEDPYLYLPKLAKHQRLEPDKVKSRLPEPPSSAPCSDESESRANESARGADESGRRADRSALLYGAGSIEHVAGSMNAARGSDRAARESRPSASMLGNALLDEHVRACTAKPPRDVQRTTGEKIDTLLAEDFSEDQVRAGLRLMRERGKGPGLLPHLVNELVNPAVSTDGGRRPRRGGAADDLTDQKYGPGSTDI